MPVYLSASSISDFIKCPQKVLYRLKKTVPEIPNKDMITGKIIHFALEKGWDNRERANSIIEQECEREKLKKYDETRLKFMVDMFFLNFKHLVAESDFIEYRFKIPLYDDVFIVGKMDRISKGYVYDWKSGRVATKLYNDVQCIIYEWAFQKLFQKDPNGVRVAALSTGELLYYNRDNLYVKEIFENIIPRMIRTVRHDSYERLGLFNHSCFRCPYKLGCLGGAENELDNTVSPE
jgi:CRISPR/Cas system-associated exonuclease Cas4 (RecB family)